MLCNMHHLAVDCLGQGLCFLGKYHILAGKLLSRTVEVWTSADNFNILHFSYMKLSCFKTLQEDTDQKVLHVPGH